MNSDRAVLLDEDVAKVIRFMEKNVAADRLQQVARHLPEVAALIWSADRCASLFREPLSAPPRAASESFLVETCVGDDSAAAESAH